MMDGTSTGASRRAHTRGMSAPPELPELVLRALRMSLQRGYVQASRTETGRLLATLAATRTGTIAECGTGCGVGAAWLRSGAPKSTRVVTAEVDPGLAHGVMAMFADDDLVTMTHAVEMYEALPNAELAVVPGTSHFLTQEKPHLVNQLVLDFLTNKPVQTVAPIRRARPG